MRVKRICPFCGHSVLWSYRGVATLTLFKSGKNIKEKRYGINRYLWCAGCGRNLQPYRYNKKKRTYRDFNYNFNKYDLDDQKVESIFKTLGINEEDIPEE